MFGKHQPAAACLWQQVPHHLCCLSPLPSTHPTTPAQGEIFAAEGYAKTTGRVGVCIATSGPGATNLVTGLADAMMDSVPLVAITGQVRGWSQQLGCVQSDWMVLGCVRSGRNSM